MPPKKKKRKTKQPTQRQSQKQVVNITFADKKNKRRKRRPVKKDNLQMAVQSLSSNLNMFSSDTARLNNLENLIIELRREQRQPISTGVITPTSIMATQTNIPVSVMETQTNPIYPTLKKTKKTQTKSIPILTPDVEAPLIPTKSPKPAPVVEKEEGDLADLLNPIRPFVRVSGEQEPITKVKDKLKINFKKRAEKSAETVRPNTTDEDIQGGGEDIEIPLKKERKENIQTTRNKKADALRKSLLLRKGIQGLTLTTDKKDREQYEKIVNKMSDMTETDNKRTEDALKFIAGLKEGNYNSSYPISGGAEYPSSFV
tara:strand:- start:1086 stop:2030 length:945 start_codon:yes stop_codon:yes gene_type:complete